MLSGSSEVVSEMCACACPCVSVCVCVCVTVCVRARVSRGSIISPARSHGSSSENTRPVSEVRLRNRVISMPKQAKKLPSST